MKKLNPEFIDMMNNMFAGMEEEKERNYETAVKIAAEAEVIEEADTEAIAIGVDFATTLMKLGFEALGNWPEVRLYFGEEMQETIDEIFEAVSIEDNDPEETE